MRYYPDRVAAKTRDCLVNTRVVLAFACAVGWEGEEAAMRSWALIGFTFHGEENS